MNKAIRILLVADHEVIRQGLRHMLESEEDMEVVGDCSNAEEALAKVVTLLPNMVLMDTQMPEMSEIEAARNFTRNWLDYGADVIILGESMDYQAEALETGAAGYLLKDVTRMELVQAIRQVYRNRHSLEDGDRLVEEMVELVIPPPVNAAQLLGFMCQLGGLLHNDFASIICVGGSWDCGTVITIEQPPTLSSSLLIKLTNMPEIEKVEEEPLTGGTTSTFSKKSGFLLRPSIIPSRRICVTLRETAIAKQSLITTLN